MTLFNIHYATLYAQDFLPDAKVMQNKKVKTVTQFDCDSTGNNCFILNRKYYDKLGQLYLSEDYAQGQVYLTTTYSYFQKDKIDTVFQTVQDQEKRPVVIYVYDAAGNKVEQLQYSLNTEPVLRTVYSYNNAQQVQTEIVKQGQKAISEKKFFYDTSGNVSKTIEKYYPDGLPETILFFYDRLNRCSKIKYSDREEEYFYDNEANLVKINFLEYGTNSREVSLLNYSDQLLISSKTFQHNDVLFYFKYTYEFY
ncbi:hypothetical protein [Lacibacter cauensis]|nr:hypothetical protein [Lacibacter cauensis]